MSKRAKDRPESIKIRVITPEGRYQTVEVTRTDMKKSLAAKVLAETGSLAKAAKKSGIPLWGIKSWYRDSKSFKEMYQWSLDQRSWRYRTKRWIRDRRAELYILTTRISDRLERIVWKLDGLWLRLSRPFEPKRTVDTNLVKLRRMAMEGKTLDEISVAMQGEASGKTDRQGS